MFLSLTFSCKYNLLFLFFLYTKLRRGAGRGAGGRLPRTTLQSLFQCCRKIVRLHFKLIQMKSLSYLRIYVASENEIMKHIPLIAGFPKRSQACTYRHVTTFNAHFLRFQPQQSHVSIGKYRTAII